MYIINYSDFGPFKQIKISDKKTGESFSFLPGFGACMNQLVLKGKNGINYKLLYSNTDYQSLITEGKQKFIGSKLFPFPNRINMGSYNFSSKEYRLPINFPSEGHAIHGLVLESDFKVSEITLTEKEGKAILVYDYDKENAGYPFRFNIKIEFSLSSEGFTCRTHVTNTDTLPIPVGDGWHPYFRIGDRINDLYLSIPAIEEIEVNELKIPNGKSKLCMEEKDFCKLGTRTFDTCFKLAEEKGISTVKLWDKSEDIQLHIWMESGKDQYQYVQIYTPPGRDSIAVEPMTCMPDAFNNQKGLIIIPPGETKSFVWGIILK